MADARALDSVAGVIRIPLLDEAACDDWAMHVSLLSGHWRSRHPQVPFYTLGQAAYLDSGGGGGGGQDGGGYHDGAARSRNNRLLRDRFLPLLNRVAEALGAWTDLPRRIPTSEAAVPGFHIYLPHPAFAGDVAKRHRDLQYQAAFPGRAVPVGGTFSFTLPLSNPPGSGMTLWPNAASAPVRVAYVTGELVVHSGACDHRVDIACTGDMERITLQGHGVRFGDHVLLYW